jgi:hypothetical protein
MGDAHRFGAETAVVEASRDKDISARQGGLVANNSR